MHRSALCLLVLVAMFLIAVSTVAPVAYAQTMLHPTVTLVAPAASTSPNALPAPDQTLGTALRNLAARAGLVFTGQVVAIERKAGVVEITFTVQQAVQGSVGPTYTLREWAGLWAAGTPRYVLGQRALLFLNPVSAAGLSSPVDGMEGVVPLVPMGANAAAMLDVRRLATRLQRAPGAPLAVEAIALPDAVAALAASASSAPASAAAVEPPARTLPLGWKPVVPMPVLGARYAVQ